MPQMVLRLVMSATLLCAASSARAQQPQTAQAAPPASSASADDARARGILRVLAEQERSARYAEAYSMFIIGAAALSSGLIADLAYDRSYGTFLWVAGALLGVNGLTSLLFAGMYERLARDAPAYDTARLQLEWSQRALAARSARKLGGVIGLGLGAVAIGFGGAFAAGLSDLSRSERQAWTTGLIAFGGGMMGQALLSLLVESPLEVNYRIAYGSDPESAPRAFALNVAPTLGGAALCLQASF